MATSLFDDFVQFQPPTNFKEVRCFLGHSGFYRKLIKDFSKIPKPLRQGLEQDVTYHLSKECLKAFMALKNALILAMIFMAPDWSKPFELMYDATNLATGVLLGKSITKYFILSSMQVRPSLKLKSTIHLLKKELLDVVFSFNNF